MAGKRDSPSHSPTSFIENVVVAKTRYQMLQVLAFYDRERVKPPSLKITVLTFLVRNGKMKLSGKSIQFENTRKSFKYKSRPRLRI